MLDKQAAQGQTSAPVEPPVEPPKFLATSLFDQCKANLEAKAGVGTTIERLERQLAQKLKSLEPDKNTELGMEVDKAEDQELKKFKVEQ